MQMFLTEVMFQPLRQTIVQGPDLAIDTHRFASGVAALTIKTDRIEMTCLPFRGQQIWDVVIDGEPITMKSHAKEPSIMPTLLESFGAFLFHCGLSGTAAPGPKDDHALHGELPMAPMDKVWLTFDQNGVKLSCSFTYHKTFGTHYCATPSVYIAFGQTTFSVTMEIKNLGNTAMPFMYLAHPNFRPVDGARLAYSALYSPGAVRMRAIDPAHITTTPAYLALKAQFLADPMMHHRLPSGQAFDPEFVFEIDYIADKDGWAHSLQIHPDGSSDWSAHRPQSCPCAIRWISRTADHDAIALAEPSTSWAGGFSFESAQGRVPSLEPRQVWETKMQFGRLTPAQTQKKEANIAQITGT